MRRLLTAKKASEIATSVMNQDLALILRLIEEEAELGRFYLQTKEQLSKDTITDLRLLGFTIRRLGSINSSLITWPHKQVGPDVIDEKQ